MRVNRSSRTRALTIRSCMRIRSLGSRRNLELGLSLGIAPPFMGLLCLAGSMGFVGSTGLRRSFAASAPGTVGFPDFLCRALEAAVAADAPKRVLLIEAGT